jgi:hypothetical protein
VSLALALLVGLVGLQLNGDPAGCNHKGSLQTQAPTAEHGRAVDDAV